MSILVIDMGTSSVRASIVHPDATVDIEVRRETLPDTPVQGLVEFDAPVYADAALDCAREALGRFGPVEAVGVANQRATTIVWDRKTGVPVAPAQGWQDLRTVGDCLVLAAEGFRFAPNQSATKLANILDAVDPDRRQDLCFGTPESWIIWQLTEGAHHVADLSNAAVWGLLAHGGDPLRRRRRSIGSASRPRCCRGSSTRPGSIGAATALRGRAGHLAASPATSRRR